MNPEQAGLCLGLMDALDAFDQATPKLGLYACEELLPPAPRPDHHPEWTLCLKPYLQQLGYRLGQLRPQDIRQGRVWFYSPDGVGVSLQLIRTSKVKVRKFGSRYRVDPQNKYEERWNELQVERHLRELWKNRYSDLRVLLFIGFERGADPFGEELAELSAMTRWEKHGVESLTRAWPDRYERDFAVRLCAWSHWHGKESEQ